MDLTKTPLFQAPIQHPTLFIKGETSNYIKTEYEIEINKQFKSVQIVTINGVGHWVHFQAPKDFLNNVCEFMNPSKSGIL